MNQNFFQPTDLTRAAGLTRLAEVLPRLGLAYARDRNYVPAPGEFPFTSLLSPYLRHRLLTEQEVLVAVTAAHGPYAEKFASEIYWRTYFKGHLEQHPAIWHAFRTGLSDAEEKLARIPGLGRLYAQAAAGATGIDCFDAWCRELTETGWLHNHVRLWFASIWIFSLGLPWQLGAEFFAHHLLDHDPASNTLGWRWVAGLHTRGKPYVARAENIARYTAGRFNPTGLLDEAPCPVIEPEPPPAAALPTSDTWPRTACVLLLHEDDLAPESLVPDYVHIVRIAVLASPSVRAPRAAAARVTALADAAARAEAAFDAPAALLPNVTDVAAWAEGAPIATPHAPVGAAADALATMALHRIQRPWDQHHWPHCTRGFFQLRAKIS
ncbi:MAG TPA: FAD-binding domain-containing protein [Acetobacteraceae bacterium]|nr:FAD-binding domain-containing protein [Acetobacteraceae bacterium]